MLERWRVAMASRYPARMLSGSAQTQGDVAEPDLDEWTGRWVAIKGGQVIEAADSPQAIVEKLEQRGAEASGAVVRYVGATDRAVVQ